VVPDLEKRPAVTDTLAARRSGSALGREQWGDNVFLETVVEGDSAAFRHAAPIVVRRSLHTARQRMSPLEGRRVLAT
jgi:hypothetical protein